ncbi:MAG: CRISPR-associated protein Cas2 [Oceanotoga sp.]|jgi:CRISPR-associated protein Cas2|uniref:CRISPR-associated endonuclease Cas2 n=1 Tax=Oceanotoga sp. TaxID=2108366 RepID=UPI002656A175|nr:CRISPR-associated endonuclease Cas2 [Oceanotoga sp.]MDN5342622.1 CRISPR-associated protein Cas2 [Oceanotoga sp.]
MYVIVVYDVNTKRVGKVHKLLKKYLNWIQNSAFEGYITNNKLKEMKNNINSITKKDEDSIICFETYTKKNIDFNVFGIEKNKYENII